MQEPAPPVTTLEFDPGWILFQGNGVLAVNKPAGIPVHRGTGHELGVCDLIESWSRLHPGLIELRAGNPVRPAHRLDLEASGVLLLTLTKHAASELQQAIAAHVVEKRYYAVVAGPLEEKGTIRGLARSRLRGVYRTTEEELRYRRLQGDDRLSLIEVTPNGGKTHQIRALLAQAGRPLAGDLRYGKPKPARQFLEKFGVDHLLLHAHEATLPARLGLPRTLRAPLPEAWRKVAAEKGWSLPG